MDEFSVLNHLVERSGVADRNVLRRALNLTLRGIRDAIGHSLARRVAARLPDSMAIVLRGPTHAASDLPALYERIHADVGLRRDAATEVAQACLGFVGSLLSDDDLSALMTGLPPQWAVLVDRREQPRPLAVDDHFAMAHRESIATNDDPHRDTRLSSASRVRGSKLSEARPGAGDRSLATARPGAGPRSLAEAEPGARERSLAHLRSVRRADDRSTTRK